MEDNKANLLKSIQKGGRKLSSETRERTVGYIEAGLGLVAGLAWNEAVKAAIETFFPVSKSTIIAKFIYAVIITFIIVVISSNLQKISGKKGHDG